MPSIISKISSFFRFVFEYADFEFEQSTRTDSIMNYTHNIEWLMNNNDQIRYSSDFNDYII